MDSKRPKQILIVPLDWGLGHTTRCIPLIRYIQQQGHHIIMAGNEWQCSYINKSFPGIETIYIDGYEVSYSKRRKGFMFAILSQVPRLLKTIRREHEWLTDLAAKRRIDGIISDNRYGLFHPGIPSAVMTHQLLAQTGMGDVMDNMLRRLHYKYLQRFGECWIADVPDAANLSGKLGHPAILPHNARYIGLLSQLEPASQPAKEQLLILLSGPEPQRTMLSDLLWEQVKDYTGKVVFVEGSAKAPRLKHAAAFADGQGTYYTRLTGTALQPVFEKAAIVVCRSGYSTLMDLAVMKKKAILVPTPGQTEQEYLAKHLHKEGVFYSSSQKHFNLQQALTDAQLFPFKPLQLHGAHELYKRVLAGWLAAL